MKNCSLIIFACINTACLAAEVGQIDPDFKQPSFVTKNVNFSYVSKVATTQRGKILIGGSFLRVSNVERKNLAQLNEDGSLDTTFVIPQNLTPHDGPMAILCDGKIMIGAFLYGPDTATPTTKGKKAVPILPFARINSNGTLDDSFVRSYGGLGNPYHANYHAAHLDGSLICTFGFPHPEYRKLNPDGSLANDFNFARPSEAQTIRFGQFDHKGRVIVSMTMRGDKKEEIHELLRLTPDGSQDATFTPTHSVGTRQDARYVGSHQLCPDGGILFLMVRLNNGKNSWRLMRMSAEGHIDESFQSPEPPGDGGADTFALQEDGKIICLDHVGGNSFDTRATHVYRLNSDGSIDPTFPRKTARRIGWHGVTLQPDGKILLYGDTMVSPTRGEPIIIRLLNDPCVDELQVLSKRSVSWIRGGSAPAVTQTMFSLSVDEGKTWKALGLGTRGKEAWELEGLELPPAGLVRASGRNALGVVEQTKRFLFEEQ